MLNAMSSLLSALARRVLPLRRRKSITCSALVARRPFFPCGAGLGDVSDSTFFVRRRTLRKVTPRRRIQERKRGRGHGKGKGKGGGDLLDGDEPCVWRRTILLGRRCQPLEFTGAIQYDCEGQRLWQTRTPPLSPVHTSDLGYMDRA